MIKPGTCRSEVARSYKDAARAFLIMNESSNGI
jgi:hypothetical protein